LIREPVQLLRTLLTVKQDASFNQTDRVLTIAARSQFKEACDRLSDGSDLTVRERGQLKQERSKHLLNAINGRKDVPEVVQDGRVDDWSSPAINSSSTLPSGSLELTTGRGHRILEWALHLPARAGVVIERV